MISSEIARNAACYPRSAMRVRASFFAPLALVVAACGLHQAGNGDVCSRRTQVPGAAEATGASTGSLDVRLAGGAPSSISFSTPPLPPAHPTQTYYSASFGGEVHDDGSGDMHLMVSDDQSSLHPSAELTVPDVRSLREGAVVSIPVSGTLALDDGTTCTFFSVASLAITRAVGAGAPAPAFVTSDFDRAGTLTLDPTPLAAVIDAGAPECAGTIAVHATLELTPASYVQRQQDSSCVSLGK